MSANDNIMYKAGAYVFWKWFEENEEQIKDDIVKKGSIFTGAIDDELSRAFPFLDYEFDYDIEFNHEGGVFYIFHLDRNDFRRMGRALGKYMPPELAKRWKFLLRK